MQASEFVDQIDSEMAEWFRGIQQKQEASSGRPPAPVVKTETKTLLFASQAEADRYILERRTANSNAQPAQ